MNDGQPHTPPVAIKHKGVVLHFLRKDQRLFLWIIALALLFSTLGFLVHKTPLSSFFGVAVLILIMFLILSAAVYVVMRRFILPSEYLISYMLAQSRGDQFPEIQKLPPTWKPWGHALSLIFRKNR